MILCERKIKNAWSILCRERNIPREAGQYLGCWYQGSMLRQLIEIPELAMQVQWTILFHDELFSTTYKG